LQASPERHASRNRFRLCSPRPGRRRPSMRCRGRSDIDRHSYRQETQRPRSLAGPWDQTLPRCLTSSPSHNPRVERQRDDVLDLVRMTPVIGLMSGGQTRHPGLKTPRKRQRRQLTPAPTTLTATLLLNVMGAFAGFERSVIREGQRASRWPRREVRIGAHAGPRRGPGGRVPREGRGRGPESGAGPRVRHQP
jgi:hypothetical protein